MSGLNLKHYKEFEETLRNYSASQRALNALKGLKLVLMIAPTSSGRNTIIRHLVETGDYYYIVSDTTRPPRINDGIPEQDGQEYWFRSEEEVLADLKAGEYLEAEIIHNQQVSGISIRELEQAKAKGKIAITDIDLEGVRNIMKIKPDTYVIMLIPPSFDEWQRRIAQRGRMSETEYIRRLQTADRIFKEGLNEDFYHFVISEDLDQSTDIINSITKNTANPHQDRGRELIRSLQQSLELKLGPHH